MIFARRNLKRRSVNLGTIRTARTGETCETRSLLSAVSFAAAEPESPRTDDDVIAHQGPQPGTEFADGEEPVLYTMNIPESSDPAELGPAELGPEEPDDQSPGPVITMLSPRGAARNPEEWRTQVRRELIRQADEWFGEMFSQSSTFTEYVHPWNTVPSDSFTPTDDFAPTDLFAPGPDSDGSFPDSPAAVESESQFEGSADSDLIESDGEFLYFVSGNQLSIIRAGGVQQTQALSQTAIDGRPVAMFVNGNRLTVVTVPWTSYFAGSPMKSGTHAMPEFRYEAPTVAVTVLNIADRRAPEVVSQSLVDGTYVDSRRVADDVLVVVGNGGAAIDMPSLEWRVTDVRETVSESGDTWLEQDITYESRDQYLARIETLIESLYPPSVYQQTESGQSLGWLTDDLSLIPIAGNGQSLISVVRLRTTGDGARTPDAVSIATSGWNSAIYVTPNSLWLAVSESIPSQDQFGPDSETLTEPEVTWLNDDDFAALTSLEGPELNIDANQELSTDALVDAPAVIDSGPVIDFGPTTFRTFDITTFYRIDLSSERMTVSAIGTISGTVSDSNAIDEYNGILRVVASQRDDNEAVSTALFLLQETDGILTAVGRVDGLAPGETVFSTNFDGDRAWITTFEQTDSPIALDLSDAANPFVSTELTIPGFPDYVQSIDRNHVVAIEQRKDPQTNETSDLVISIFDVSDMSTPRLLHRYVFGVAESGRTDAVFDRLTYLWMPEDGVLVIPIFRSETVEESPGFLPFAAADSLAVLSISIHEGITLLGVADQSHAFARSLQVGAYVYSVTADSVSIADASHPGEVLKVISLSPGNGTAGTDDQLTEQRDLYRRLFTRGSPPDEPNGGSSPDDNSGGPQPLPERPSDPDPTDSYPTDSPIVFNRDTDMFPSAPNRSNNSPTADSDLSPEKSLLGPQAPTGQSGGIPASVSTASTAGLPSAVGSFAATRIAWQPGAAANFGPTESLFRDDRGEPRMFSLSIQSELAFSLNQFASGPTLPELPSNTRGRSMNTASGRRSPKSESSDTGRFGKLQSLLGDDAAEAESNSDSESRPDNPADAQRTDPIPATDEQPNSAAGQTGGEGKDVQGQRVAGHSGSSSPRRATTKENPAAARAGAAAEIDAIMTQVAESGISG